jgi:hypothetical protein
VLLKNILFTFQEGKKMSSSSARKLIDDIKQSSRTSPILAPLSNPTKLFDKNELSSDFESSSDQDQDQQQRKRSRKRKSLEKEKDRVVEDSNSNPNSTDSNRSELTPTQNTVSPSPLADYSPGVAPIKNRNHQSSVQNSKIFKLARTLKRAAASERDGSKPNDHPQNLKSFALSMIAGLRFIESGIKETQDSSRIFSDLIKYFEYFAQLFQKSNMDQFYIVACECIAFCTLKARSIQANLARKKSPQLEIKVFQVLGDANNWEEFEKYVKDLLNPFINVKP